MVEILQMDGDIIEAFPDAVVNVASCTGLIRNATTHRLSKAFPSAFQDYKRMCIRKKLQLGTPHYFAVEALFGTRYIITLPIKSHWNETMRPPLVKDALKSLIQTCKEHQISVLAIPQFEGPPAGWLQEKLGELAAATTHPEKILLFRE